MCLMWSVFDKRDELKRLQVGVTFVRWVRDVAHVCWMHLVRLLQQCIYGVVLATPVCRLASVHLKQRNPT